MRGASLLATLIATAAFFCGGVAFAQVGETTPAGMIRSIEFVQDAVVNGDHAAIEMQRHLLQLFDERIRRADASLFDDEANVHALLIYSMSGGNPQTLGAVVGSDPEERFDPRLVAVIDAYLRGRAQPVADELLTLLPDYRDGRLEPYLTLVAANAAATAKPDVALGLLDRARLLSPGTIIEEAALRRSIFLAGRNGEVERGLAYANRYARRFLNSPYASHFADLFVGLVLQHPDAMEADDIAAILAYMDPERRRSVYLRIARQAVIDGNMTLAALAAEEAKTIDESGRAAALAGLYAGVAELSSEGILEALERIEAIDAAALSPRDRALREAARRVADAVVARPVPAAPAPDAPAELMAGETDPFSSDLAQFPALPAEASAPSSAEAGMVRAAGEASEAETAADAFVSSRRALLESVDRLLEEVR